MNKPTAERVRELLNYDPLSGLFTWRVDRKNQVRVGGIAGSVNSKGYVTIWIDGNQCQAHRLAVLWMTGEYPPSDTDHVNMVKTDNRWCNLRLASRSQNMANKKNRADNTSGAKGVSFKKQLGKWCARVMFNGSRYHLGYYNTVEEASAAYAGASRLCFGDFHNLGEQ